MTSVPPGFPLRWDRPEDAELTWQQLGTGQVPPLIAALERLEFAAFARGFALHGRPQVKIMVMDVAGFVYRHEAWPDASVTRAWEEQPPGEMAAAAADPLRYWQNAVLPDVLRALARLEVDLGALACRELQECLRTALWLDEQVEMTIQPLEQMKLNIRRFRQLHLSLLGGSEHEADRLLDGSDNRLLQMTLGLVELARLQAQAPDEFAPAFITFLREHGRRFAGRDLLRPTWQEAPDTLLALLRGGLRPASGAAAATLREQALATVRRRFAEQAPRYARLLAAASAAVAIDQDYDALLQQRCRVPLREVPLALGRRYVAAHQLEQVADVWWLTPEELLAAPGDWRPLVAERRAEWARVAALPVPRQLGRPSEAPPPQPAPPPEPELRGVPASGGRVRAQARRIGSLDDAARLAPGEIIVARHLPPALTPLLGRAGAVVTDHGGALAPAALVARQFGLPAVLGTRQASRWISDGEWLAVDGGTGVVHRLDAG